MVHLMLKIAVFKVDKIEVRMCKSESVQIHFRKLCSTFPVQVEILTGSVADKMDPK